MPRTTLLVVALLLIGAGYRFLLTCTLPVGYDEVFVMGVGLDQASESSWALAFQVPITRSSAITPLWWWVQYVPVAVAGGLSLVVLRIMPVCLGIIALVLSYLLSRRMFGRRTAVVFLAFVSLSDILSFTNGRGEFAESLTVICLVIGVCLVGRSGYGIARGLVWLILLMTSLSKGIFVVGLMVLAELVILAVTRRDFAKRVKMILLGLVVAIIPTAIYLTLAGNYFARWKLIHHEATEATGIVDLIRLITFDYPQIKQHVTGSAVEAMLVWLDPGIWPVTVMSALVLVPAIIWALWRIGRRGLRPRSPREAAVLGLLVWALLGAAAVIGRGTLGARFHLLYLPAFWMLAAIWLGRVRIKTAYRRFAIASGAVACIVALVFAGPLTWAHYARFEPMARSDELEALEAYRQGLGPEPAPHGRTLFVDLANYYLITEPVTRRNLERALHYARMETERVPDDARGWAYVGEALVQLGAPVNDVREAWSRSLELAPNEKLEQRLESLRPPGG